MLIDANELPESSEIDCDVCVAGSGPAGITIASELAGGAVEVCLLETGGLPHEAAVEASNVAEQLGVPVDVLKFCRHSFGGASNLWGGVGRRWLRLRPLDPIDFEKRPWVSDSGWPFRYEELVPFFKRAGEILKIPSFGDFALAAHRDHLAPEFHNDEVNTTIFQVARPRRFGEDYARSLAMSKNVRVYTHARAIEIEEDPTAPVVRYLHFVTPGGRTHRIAARHFVLACGGLENPRLLLVSRRKAACGIGNEHDLVGRYYMQHPKGLHGIAVLDREGLRSPLYTQRYLTNDVLVSAGLSFSEEVQRREKVLNHCIMFRPILALSESHASEAYRAFCRAWHGDGRAGDYREFLAAGVSAAADLKWVLKNPRFGKVFKIANHMEQAPKPESKLDLSEHKDQFGVPQLRTDWRIDSFEKESLCRLHELVRGKLALKGVGRLESQFDPRADRWPISQDSAHHLGATRMHSDPRRGVTDPDCRVHSVQNLYISGGSLFPTSGYANPTFTIVALAIRLADHLKRLHESHAAGREGVIDPDRCANGALREWARQPKVGVLPPASVS